jgi:hypothetical protein
LIVAAGGLVAFIAVALAISLAGGGRKTSHGCIEVTVQAATGASELYRCGAQARDLCASIGAPGGPAGVLGQAVALECRRAGIPPR